MSGAENVGDGAVDGVDVLVVGAGPAGLTAAILLARRGVRVLCVDKHPGVSPQPRARGVHARAVEILRACGLEAAMRSAELPVAPRMEVRPVLGAPPVATMPTGGADFVPISPCEGLAIAQDTFEEVLRRGLADLPAARLEVECELTALRVADDGVGADLLDRPTGSTRAVRARYVVGADGWRSRVRESIGGRAEGPDDLGTGRAITFRADLRPWLEDPAPALIRLAAAEAVLLKTHPDDRWVVVGSAGSRLEDEPVGAVRTALGLPGLELEVLNDWTWTAAAQTTDVFARPPVFLVGDAAHRVPPAGATGISSAMADAHNLAWKLTAVLQGWGDEALLDRYAAERRPVALATTAAALAMWLGWARNSAPAIDLRMLDMGYRYGAPDAGLADLTGPYRQSAEVGDRAPHAWLPGGRSTLDLLGPGFTVLTADADGPWPAAAAAARTRTGVPVEAAVLTGPEAAGAYALGAGEAALVRPDGHVAARWAGPAAPSGETAAETALADALGIAVARDGARMAPA